MYARAGSANTGSREVNWLNCLVIEIRICAKQTDPSYKHQSQKLHVGWYSNNNTEDL